MLVFSVDVCDIFTHILYIKVVWCPKCQWYNPQGTSDFYQAIIDAHNSHIVIYGCFSKYLMIFDDEICTLWGYGLSKLHNKIL